MRRMEAQLFDLLALPAGAAVLDAGCGAAHVAIALASRGLQVTGIDLIERHLVYARHSVVAAGQANRVALKKMNYQDLSFPNVSFDAAYTMETLVHATDFRAALAEFHRVLRPGGRLVLIEYEHRATEGPAAAKLALVNEIASMPAFQQWTIGVLAEEMQRAGFTDIKRRDWSENVRPMMRFFALLAILPYLFIWLFGLQQHFPNATSAVEMWRYGDYVQYVAMSGDKPRKA
jgi:sterol 24-C-methyltransferase